MFSSYLGDETVASSLSGAGRRLFYSVTRDARKGKLYLKIVNGSSTSQEMNIQLAGTGKIAGKGTLGKSARPHQ